MQIHPIIDPSLQRGTAAGQMLFWTGTEWTYTETSELFWDDTNKRVGILTAAPATTLDIGGHVIIQQAGDGRSAPAADTDPHLRVYSSDAGQATDYIELFHNQTFSFISSPSNIHLNPQAGTGAATIEYFADTTQYTGVNIGNNFQYRVFPLFTQLIWAVSDAVGNQFVLCNYSNRAINHNHATQTNPTLYIHSDNNPFPDYDEWLSFAHDQTDAIVEWGSGTFEFLQAAPYLTLHNSTHENSDGGRESRINFKGEQDGTEETTLARIEVGHDGSADDEKGYIDGYTNSGSDGDSPTKQIRIQSTGDWVINKTSGIGIKVDLAAPTFGFADLLGDQFSKNTGGTKPTLTEYNDTIDAWQFSNGDEAFFSYHIPHDYVPGTDIHLHIHWSQIGDGATGGTLDFQYSAIYAKGHNQAAGSTFTSTPITDTFSSIDIDDDGSGLNQYQQHITEVTISAASATGALFDRDDFEPDGVIELTFEMVTTNLTGTVSLPFIHYVDIHYQTTGIIGTKSKAPDFYT